MTQLHEQIHLHVLQMCAEGATVPQLNEDLQFANFCRSCFQNYTVQNPSLRLTSVGHTIMRTMYEYWKLPLEPEDIILLNKGATLLRLNMHMKAPYYWDPRNFYVYHSEHALEYELVSQDFSAWIRSI